jgi:hypothetical protein
MIKFQASNTKPAEQAKTMMPVTLTLIDGETLKGTVAVPRNGRLGDVLNGKDRFILFETNAGEPVYLSHNSIAAVQSNQKPKAQQLDKSLSQIDSVSPYKMLQVEKGVDKEALRAAYHRQIKHYHPDQFSNVKLPREVRSYLDTVVQRLNKAHQDIEEEIDRFNQVQKPAPQKVAEPAASEIRYFGQ